MLFHLAEEGESRASRHVRMAVAKYCAHERCAHGWSDSKCDGYRETSRNAPFAAGKCFHIASRLSMDSLEMSFTVLADLIAKRSPANATRKRAAGFVMNEMNES